MSRFRKPSAVALAALVLLGIPYVLVWHLSWPSLDLSWSGTLVHLRGLRLPPGLGAALLIVVLWALWGLYLAGLVVEGVARLRGTQGLLRPLGPLQVVAATAVGASALAPTVALADTVTDESGTEGHETEGEGASATAPEDEEGPRSVERERVVAGFATGSAELTEGMRADLAPVVDLLRGYGDPDEPVLVTGHTDPTGDAPTNQELSERRAQAVADHLAAELGDRAPETEVGGVGSSEQREGDHADQRRVELVYTVRTGPPEQAPGDTGEPGDAAEEDVAAEGGAAAGGDAAGDTEEEVALASASQGDGNEEPERVIVMEVPDHAVTASAAFAGVLGGYVLARGGVRLPRAVLSLPRRRTQPLALPPVPPRPTPQDEIDDRVSVELGHVPGIGLTGAGMKGAARRLLFNALVAPDSGVARVLITEEDTGWLIGDQGRELLGEHPCPPVRMVDGMAKALAVLQRELHRTSGEALRTDERAPLVLVARPVPEHESALSALLLHGQHRGISAVLLGRWPLGGSCVVEEDGLITETSTPLATIFHHSWPGSDSDEVLRAIRDHRDRPVADTRPAEEDERPEAAEPVPEPAPRRTAAEAVALSGFWDTLVGDDDPEPNAFWEGVPELGVTEETGAGTDGDEAVTASEADDRLAEAGAEEDGPGKEEPEGRVGKHEPDKDAAPSVPAEVPTDTEPSPWRESAAEAVAQDEPAPTAGRGTGSRESASAERSVAPAAPEEEVAASRPKPGKPRKAGRGTGSRESASAERSVAPAAPEEEVAASRPKPGKPRKAGRGAGSRESASAERSVAQARATTQAQTQAQAPAAPEEAAASRPKPVKPRKAGRGRTWRPTEKT
ncbi:OmpA family protein [Nocardiopsis aegyptia]|uniref:Outer membrane protein OmpA-like peptidoglycan-associated protein n=1 Tax=Nocardiopsis aegyptia TaxID=220378 RepID=A0A7Z0JDD2_9ACTN|nr:OmpA family protein [Nocardiopsis aegyptia]NYJ37922.1 outer membrane protein OmpA-like peptidoglycan-associated protein [Nocardiopsis aegyptia]